MPTYTKQDVLDKIQDISTNLHSCLTAVAAKGVTVPADASLDDLGGLIRQIPDASHPDIDLPWIMNDGESAYLFPETVAAAVSVQVDCELVPVGSSYKYITGNGGYIFGLLYTDSTIRARRQMIKSPTSSSPSADNGNVAEKAWTGYPFYKRQTLQCSYYSTSGYRSSLLYNGSWTHAATSQAQSSGSNYPNHPVTLFSGISFINNTASFPFGRLPAGVKVYELDRAQQAYNATGTWSSIFTPVLHWDVNRHEYRPTFVKKSNMTYASFPKPSLYSDDGNAYYIDVTQGYQERSSANTDGTGVWRCDTDIPNSSAYTIMMGVNQAAGNDNYNEYFMDIYGVPANTYFMYIASRPYSSGNTARICYHEQLQEGVTITENYDTYVYTGQSASNNVICIDPSNNTTWYSNVTNITDSKHSTALTGKSTAPDASRGYYRIYNPYYGDASINRILYWVAIYEGTTLKHYLVNCTKTGTNGLMYDVVTKKSYNFYKV